MESSTRGRLIRGKFESEEAKEKRNKVKDSHSAGKYKKVRDKVR